MSDNHKIDKRTRRKRGNAGRKSQRARRLIEIIDDVLLMPITVAEDGLVRQVPAVGAILLQLLRKELSGSRGALVVRLGYHRGAGEVPGRPGPTGGSEKGLDPRPRDLWG
jgi:hypothetical protein